MRKCSVVSDKKHNLWCVFFGASSLHIPPTGYPGRYALGDANLMIPVMTDDERIQQHLGICQRAYERLVAEGKWLWPDSPIAADMVESENNDKPFPARPA